MKNKSVSIIFGLLVLTALVGALMLVNQNQETRRGAYFSATDLLIQPGEITGTAGGKVTAQLFAETKNGAKISSIDTSFCFGQNLGVNASNLSENVVLNTEVLKDVVDLTFTKGSSQDCIRLVAIAGVAVKPEDLKSGMQRLATLNFDALSRGSGQITIVRNGTKVGGYNPVEGATDSSLEVGTLTDAKYNISIQPQGTVVPQPTGATSGCNQPCDSNANPPIKCDSGLVCYGGVNKLDANSSSGVCRKMQCLEDTDCICSGLTTPGVTAYPTVTKTPTNTVRPTNTVSPGISIFPTNTAIPTQPPSTSDAILKYRVAFDGVIATGNNADCVINWPLQFIALGGGQSMAYSGIVPPTKEVVGDKLVFSGTLTLTGFTQKTGVAIFIKGPKHLQMKYGKNNQVGPYNRAGGEIVLTDATSKTAPVTYDFTGYPLLAGDVVSSNPDLNNDANNHQDGWINGIDFSYIKSKLGRTISVADRYLLPDLDGNCGVRSNDVQILLKSIQQKQDELY